MIIYQKINLIVCFSIDIISEAFTHKYTMSLSPAFTLTTTRKNFGLYCIIHDSGFIYLYKLFLRCALCDWQRRPWGCTSVKSFGALKDQCVSVKLKQNSWFLCVYAYVEDRGRVGFSVYWWVRSQRETFADKTTWWEIIRWIEFSDATEDK